MVEDFSELLQRHFGIVRKVSTLYCFDASDRADLAQEIAAQAWSAWPRYDRSRPFSTWLYRIALNVAITHVRLSRRRAAHFVPLDEQHHAVAAGRDDPEERLLLAALGKGIAELDPMNRALLLLYLDERSHQEIAEILGLGISNVGTRIQRLKDRLRTRFA